MRVYSHELAVAEEDIDALGHASNVAYVRWIQDVAVAHSAAAGFDFDAYRRLGAVFVVRRHEVDYLRPVLRGERILVRTWIDSAHAAKCLRATELARVVDGAIVAQSRTTWGFVEAATGRPTRIPDEVRLAFGMPPRSASVAPAPSPSGAGAPPSAAVNGAGRGDALGDDPHVEVAQRVRTRAE